MYVIYHNLKIKLYSSPNIDKNENKQNTIYKKENERSVITYICYLIISTI